MSTVSTKKHVKLAEYIQQHKKNWDLDVKVVMPGKAGKQLFKEYPLSDQSVVARAYGRKGGKAGKGTPKTGGSAKGMAKTGKAAKGMAKNGEGGQGGEKTTGQGEGGQGGSPLEYRRHGDPAGFSSRLPEGGVEALKGVAGRAASGPALELTLGAN